MTKQTNTFYFTDYQFKIARRIFISAFFGVLGLTLAAMIAHYGIMQSIVFIGVFLTVCFFYSHFPLFVGFGLFS